jgi:hypothetical protein
VLVVLGSIRWKGKEWKEVKRGRAGLDPGRWLQLDSLSFTARCPIQGQPRFSTSVAYFTPYFLSDGEGKGKHRVKAAAAGKSAPCMIVVPGPTISWAEHHS